MSKTASEILIKNGTLVIGDKLEKKDLLIKGDKIEKIGAQLTASKTAKVIDASDLLVMAGFIDMHCHLREPGASHKEDIESGCLAAAKGGFTTVCCMPNTKPVLDSVPLIRYILTRSSEVKGAKVLPIGAISKASEGKELASIKSMADAGAIAFSDDGLPVISGGLMKLALEYADTFGLLLISHAEDKSIAGDGVVNDGYNASVAGLKGICRVAEESMTARDILLAEALNSKVHIAHVSTKGAVQLIREAKARGVKVTAETCPHYFSATDSLILDYNTNAKVNPPLREESDRLAIIQGLKDGTIDAIATDHAPHHADEKAQEFNLAPFGISGLETAFSLSYTHLVKPGHININALSKFLTANPARILNLKNYELTTGATADITIIDAKAEYKINAKEFASKGKNTPFDGDSVTGAVAFTIIDGEIN